MGNSPCSHAHTQSVVELMLSTTSSGAFNLVVPIPNNSKLKGTYVRTQLAIADSSSNRPLKVNFTNALEITVQ